jgi:hypothetical protein
VHITNKEMHCFQVKNKPNVDNKCCAFLLDLARMRTEVIFKSNTTRDESASFLPPSPSHLRLMDCCLVNWTIAAVDTLSGVLLYRRKPSRVAHCRNRHSFSSLSGWRRPCRQRFAEKGDDISRKLHKTKYWTVRYRHGTSYTYLHMYTVYICICDCW